MYYNSSKPLLSMYLYSTQHNNILVCDWAELPMSPLCYK